MDLENLVNNMGLVDAFSGIVRVSQIDPLQNDTCGTNCVSCTSGCSQGCFSTNKT